MPQYLITRHDIKAVAVTARTAQAAARKIFGATATLRDTRSTAQDALLTSSVMVGDRHAGTIEESRDPGVVLVHYPWRTSDAPFWADPTKWSDEKHPIAILVATPGKEARGGVG